MSVRTGVRRTLPYAIAIIGGFLAAYLIVAGSWAALLTWKWNSLSAWLNTFSPSRIVLSGAGASAATSLSLTFFMMLIALASVTVMLAFHTILAEE